jgi:hypothetical protein
LIFHNVKKQHKKEEKSLTSFFFLKHFLRSLVMFTHNHHRQHYFYLRACIIVIFTWKVTRHHKSDLSSADHFYFQTRDENVIKFTIANNAPCKKVEGNQTATQWDSKLLWNLRRTFFHLQNDFFNKRIENVEQMLLMMLSAANEIVIKLYYFFWVIQLRASDSFTIVRKTFSLSNAKWEESTVEVEWHFRWFALY